MAAKAAWSGRVDRVMRGAAALALVMILAVGAEFSYRFLFAVQARWKRIRSPQGVFEIYGVGESTIVGAPYPGFSFPDFVSKMFDGKIKGRRIVVVNLARSGQSIYPQADGFERRLASRDRANPGVVFIYSGHNDPGQPSHTPFIEYFKEDVLFRSLILKDLFLFAESSTRVPRVRNLRTYEYYIRRVVEMSLQSGLVPILSTAVSNESGMDPGLKVLRKGALTPHELQEIIRIGERMESAGRYREAIGHYKRFMGTAGLRPYLMYKIGECRRLSGDFARAHWYYREAINLGSPDNFMRATDAQNDFLRGLAAEYHIPLVDSVKIFEEKSPHGITGNDLFADGHHPNMKGQMLLADAFARQVSLLTQEPVRRRAPESEDLNGIFKAIRYPRQKQVEALLVSARWLFTVSTQQLLPQLRLELARARYERALALEPNSFSATLGLALADAAGRGDFLRNQENIAWLSANRFYYGVYFNVAENALPGIIGKLRSAGIPEPRLLAIEDAYRRRGYASR